MIKTIAVLLALHALPLALLIPSYANAADTAHEYEVRVELNGQLYIADYGLTAGECEQTMDELTHIVDETGKKVFVPLDAPVYCVSM